MTYSFDTKKGIPEAIFYHDTGSCYSTSAGQQILQSLHPKEQNFPSTDKHQERSEATGIVDMVDYRAVLLKCAEALSGNDRRKARDLIQWIGHRSSSKGTASQRVAHYFVEAFIARLAGNGDRLYTQMGSNNIPSAVETLRSHYALAKVCPFPELYCYFVNFNILKAVEGASALHIVDYGILYGFQWLTLIRALAGRKGGPPSLKISGIEFPLPGARPAERLEDTGRRLAAYARSVGVPFEFQAVATSEWEKVDIANNGLTQKHAAKPILVVCSLNRLRHLMDETVKECCPRQQLLSNVRRMNPDLYVQGVVNAGCTAPYFMSRCKEALYHYSSIFDMLDTTMHEKEISSDRDVLERDYGRQILSVVGCEDTQRLERPETYRQWQSRTKRAGFQQLPLHADMVAKLVAKANSQSFHRNFDVVPHGAWVLLGWKGRILHALSSWQPSPT